jgi:membrane protein DedA with SNARE-associated domain
LGERLLDLLEQYGYVGLAVGVFLESMGLPVPGETALIAAAFAAARGILSLPVVIGVAALAGILGDNMGYYLGRRLGREWLE